MNKSFWHRSYLFDWLAVGGLFSASGVLSLLVVPHHRIVLPNDPSLAYPALPSIVPSWQLVFINFLLPILAFAIFFCRLRSLHDFHHACLVLLQGLSLTVFVTACYKNYAGRPRPHWDAAKEIDPIDVWLAFPSGHSSSSMSAMSSLTLYMLGKFAVYHAEGQFWQLLLSLSPVFGAGFIAISRTRDYHHDYSDIIAGWLLGAAAAYATYFMHFHGLATCQAGSPKLRCNTGLQNGAVTNDGKGRDVEALVTQDSSDDQQ